MKTTAPSARSATVPAARARRRWLPAARTGSPCAPWPGGIGGATLCDSAAMAALSAASVGALNALPPLAGAADANAGAMTASADHKLREATPTKLRVRLSGDPPRGRRAARAPGGRGDAAAPPRPDGWLQRARSAGQVGARPGAVARAAGGVV